MNRRLNAASRQAGASLIEVLVSVLVIALGILTMAAVQSNAIRFQKTSEFRAIATLMASELADRMRANEIGVSDNLYAVASASYSAGKITTDNQGSAQTCGTLDASKVLTGCTVQQMASQDLYEWRKRVRMTLPGASIHIGNFDATQNAAEFWIAWTEADDKDASGASRSAVSAECPPTTVWAATTTSFQCVFLRVAL